MGKFRTTASKNLRCKDQQLKSFTLDIYRVFTCFRVEASLNYWLMVLLVIGSAVVGSMSMSICSSCPYYPCTQGKISRCFF